VVLFGRIRCAAITYGTRIIILTALSLLEKMIARALMVGVWGLWLYLLAVLQFNIILY